MTTPQSHEALIAELRAALIACGRSAGALLADDVSNDFLMFVPGEVKAKIEALSRPTVARVPEGLAETLQNAIYALEYWDREALVRGAGKFEDERRRGWQEIANLRAMLAASQSKEPTQIAQPDYDKLGLGDPEGRN